MELKSLPYVYSLMGIITVLCKGFILLCSMHKNVLSLMISRSVLFTDFFKGNWTILALVDHCAFQKSPVCYVLLPCQEITHRTHLFSPQYQTPEICFFRYCCFPPAVTHPLMGSTALSLCFSFQERRPLTCSTWHYLFRVSGRIVTHCHNFCAYDAFSLQHQWILLFFSPKEKEINKKHFS